MQYAWSSVKLPLLLRFIRMAFSSSKMCLLSAPYSSLLVKSFHKPPPPCLRFQLRINPRFSSMSAKRSTDASLSPSSKRSKNSPSFSWSSPSFDGEHEPEEGQPFFGTDNVETHLSSNVTTWQMIGDPNFIHDTQQYSAFSSSNLGDDEQEFIRSYNNGNSLYNTLFGPEPWQSFGNKDAATGSSRLSRMGFGPSEGHGNTWFKNWDLQSLPTSQGSIGSTIASNTTSFHSGISMKSREPSNSSPFDPTLQGLYESMFSFLALISSILICTNIRFGHRSIRRTNSFTDEA